MKKENNNKLLEELTRSKIRVNHANAEKNELKNAQTKGKLITIEAVNAKWAEDVSNVKAKLLAIPSKLAPRLAGLDAREIYNILNVAIYEALNELAGEYK